MSRRSQSMAISESVFLNKRNRHVLPSAAQHHRMQLRTILVRAYPVWVDCNREWHDSSAYDLVDLRPIGKASKNARPWLPRLCEVHFCIVLALPKSCEQSRLTTHQNTLEEFAGERSQTFGIRQQRQGCAVMLMPALLLNVLAVTHTVLALKGSYLCSK